MEIFFVSVHRPLAKIGSEDSVETILSLWGKYSEHFQGRDTWFVDAMYGMISQSS